MEQLRCGTRAAMLEQVMRVVDDDLPLLPFLDAEPSTADAYEALGRLLGDASVPLRVGDPLVAYCGGGDVSEDWRERVGCAPNSLWGNLEMLVSLYGGNLHSDDPYRELCRLRELADAELGIEL